MSVDSEVKISVVVFILTFAACERAWHAYKRRKSETWPVSYGVVTEASVHKGHAEITLTVRYSYPAQGEPYPVPAEFQKTFSSLRDEPQAERWAEALVQKQIPIRFDPRNQWRSTLWESDLEPIVKAHSDRQD
jgi:hypothetical protein